MGMTYVGVKITGPKGSEETELLTDTGSTFTWISADILRRAGVEPVSKRRFKTMEGREIERMVGEARLEALNEHATTIVVFGEKGDGAVLGAYSLEGLGLQVDPVTRQLRKVEAFIAYSGTELQQYECRIELLLKLRGK
jgi:predicted aspartyl protease